MPDVENSILIFGILLVIIIAVAVDIYIVKSNKKFIQKVMANDYNKYKIELKEQSDNLAKQLLKQENNKDNTISNIVMGHVPEKNLMNIFIKLREAIKESCVDAMNQIGAARIGIYLFHNGVHSTHGVSFFKMSCICEKVAIGSGIRERIIDHTNIPINLFDDMIDKLITYDRYIIMNNENLQETTHKMFISADKIDYTQLVAIYDINNNMLGFVSVEMDRPYSKNDADKEKEILDELSKQLTPVLSYSDYISIKS